MRPRGPRGGGVTRNIWISWAVVALLAGGPLALPVVVGAQAQQGVAGTWTGTARGVAGLQP
jgi:hypothetical protein